MKTGKFFLVLSTMCLLIIPGTAYAANQSDMAEEMPAIVAALDKTDAAVLDDAAAAAVRGTAATKYVLVKILGINAFDGGPGVVWTWNPLGYRYGSWGGPGWSAGLENPPSIDTGVPGVDAMDNCFKVHDIAYTGPGSNEDRLLADKCLFGALYSLPNAFNPYWGYIYLASPTGLTTPNVYVSGVSLIGGKIFFGWRGMPYTEYSRREAVAAVRVMVKVRSVASSIRLQ